MHPLRQQNQENLVVRADYDIVRSAEADSVFLVKRSYRATEESHLQRLRAEFQILSFIPKRLPVPKPRYFSESAGTIQYDNIRGASLQHVLANDPPDLRAAISLFLDVLGTIAELHRRGIAYLGLATDSILIGEDDSRPYLIDFALARRVDVTQATGERGIAVPISAYTPPELTGATDLDAGFAADLYALGALLYEIFAKQAPFADDSEVVLLHKVLTQTPTSLKTLGVPSAVASIVAKLLKKAPHERYASADCLRVDLSCWAKNSSLPPATGEDCGERSSISWPNKIFGRDHELDLFEAALRRSESGKSTFVMAEGVAGSGKTQLAKQAIFNHRTKFNLAWGKCDELQSDVPYQAFVRAIQDFVQRIVMGPGDELRAWRERLQESCDCFADLLVSAFPDLAALLGPVPEIHDLGPTERETRFTSAFATLVKSLVMSEAPLLLVLDDLQWADAASLRLIAQIGKEFGGHRLCVVMLFRPTTVAGVNACLSALAEVDGSFRLALSPLSVAHMAQLLEALFLRRLGSVEALAAVVHKKTGGNPFSARAYIKALQCDGHIYKTEDRGAWCWNSAEISTLAFADSVEGFWSRRLKNLPAQANQLLELIACHGGDVSIEVLAELSGLTVAGVEALLEPALRCEAVQRGGRQVWFSHDCIRYAVYDSIERDLRASLHLRTAKNLAKASAGSADALFAAANQANLAGDVAVVELGDAQVAHMNFLAGQKAKLSAAYRAAESYLERAKVLLERGDNTPQLRSVCLDLAECKGLLGVLPDADENFLESIALSESAEQIADVHARRAELLTAVGEFRLAIDAACDGLRILGTDIEREPDQQAVAAAWRRAKFARRGRSPAELAQAPVVSSQVEIARLQLFASLLLPAYFLNFRLYNLALLGLATITFRSGNSSLSAAAYAGFGTYLAASRRDPEAGRPFGDEALHILERDPTALRPAFVHFNVGANIKQFLLPLQDRVKHFLSGQRVAERTGDLNWGGFCYGGLSFRRFLHGSRLDEVFSEVDQYLKSSTNRIGHLAQEVLWTTRDTIQELRDELPTRGRATSPVAMVDFDKTANYQILCRMIVLYLRNEQEAAHGLRTRVCWEQFALCTEFIRPQFFLVYGLVIARMLRQGYAPRQSLQRDLRRCIKELEWWHKRPTRVLEGEYLLLLGEAARARRRPELAVALLERAEAALTATGALFKSAIATELAARACVEMGASGASLHYIQRSLAYYAEWGARGKLRELQSEFGVVVVAESDKRNHFDDSELACLLSAAELLSCESSTSHLYEELLRNVLQAVGVARGVVLLHQDGKLVRVADVSSARADETSAHRTGAIPRRLISYADQVRRTIVVNSAAELAEFTVDPYLEANRPQSILCLPMLRRGAAIGMLYLENALTPHVFTERKVAFIGVLAAQAGMTVENARLYSKLEERVRQRTHELEKAQAQLVRLEKNSIERQMAGGFAHEMRNALCAAGVHEHKALGAGASGLSPVEQIAASLREILDLSASDVSTRGRETIRGASKTIVGNVLTLEDAITGIGVATRRALKLTDQVMRYARLQRVEPNTSNVDAGAVMRGILGESRYALAGAGVELSCEIEEAVYLRIEEEHLHSILTNLLNNAADAMTGCTEKRMTVNLTARRRRAVFEVGDTGMGIDEEMLARVFDPFFSTKGALGSGLGLSIVRKLVELYGGTIECESQVGQGTVFTVVLPMLTEFATTHGVGSSLAH